MNPRHEAGTLNDEGLSFQERGQLKQAAACFRRAAAVDPSWSTPLYNLGLLYKRRRKWDAAVRCNRQATAIDPANQAAWWNLGIAATALRRWETARAAWRGFGIDVPTGRGPLKLSCGFGPVRLNPEGEAEVVWAYRLDPARAELASIPFPESGHRWRDLVLNDGAPNGYRRYKGKDVPVFDVLQLLRPSRYGTYIASVAVSDPTAASSLSEIADQRGGSAEDWTTSTRILCKACSEGRPHAEHDTAAAPPTGTHIIGIAARGRARAAAILRAWEEGAKSVEVQSLEVGLRARKPKKHGG
jgi:tetratricopeptide (TPR) repeat protein